MGLPAACVHVSPRVWPLTLHRERDGLAGLVLAILIVDRLDVVAAGIRRHGGQDDQRVVKCDGTENKQKKPKQKQNKL